jgi:hypothetical protein
MSLLNDRITATEVRLKQLKAKQQRIEACRKTVETNRARKADIRRKILIGAVVLAKIERNEFKQEQLNMWLNEALTRPDDRALFGLTSR